MKRTLAGPARAHRGRPDGGVPEPVVLNWSEVGADDSGAAWLSRLTGALWHSQRPVWTDASWWEATLRDEVRALLWQPAGPELAAGLASLPRGAVCRLPHEEDRMLSLPTPGHSPGWPCACQVVIAAAWEACAAWVAANGARALIEAAGPEPVHLTVAGGAHQLHDPARDELAPALRWTVTSAGNRIAAARDLVAQPELLRLVETAAISSWSARLVCDHLADLSGDQAAAVVEDVRARVGERLASGRRAHNSAEINRIARTARLRICPEPEREARVRAWARRRVMLHRQADGMATLIADLAEADAHRIHRRLTAIATGLQTDASSEDDARPDSPADNQPDLRTRDQVRADVLVDLLLGAPPTAPDARDAHPAAHWDGPSPRTTASSRPDIQVIVTLETLLGLADQPAEVPGLGPIPADVVRALAADGRWTAWLTDAAGAVRATGSAGYVPSAALARLVRAREPHCRFPGCRQPASRCDLDHTIPWPRGATTPQNLGPLCRRHHQLKTHGGWRVESPEPTGSPPDESAWRWTTPAGLRHVDRAEPPLL